MRAIWWIAYLTLWACGELGTIAGAFMAAELGWRGVAFLVLSLAVWASACLMVYLDVYNDKTSITES